MDFIDRITDISARIRKQREHVQTEEATKNAFIMPFISALGYDVFNPVEVIPEYTADVGTKKGEKVDYAIKKDEQMIILIECKLWETDLEKKHEDQLRRYFNMTEARFGILTNGIQYQFFSDLDEPNKMDSKPFFEFNVLDFNETQIQELKKFTKPNFSLEDILTTAGTLKYTGAILKLLQTEFDEPSEDFIRLFAGKVTDKRLTQSVIDQFREIVTGACKQFITSEVNDRLQSALAVADTPPHEEPEPEEADEESGDGIVTTEEEIEAYHIIKAILRETVDVSRVSMRDTKSYCGILLDDNNRKPICRLRFNTGQKYLGLFQDKQEEKQPIETVDEIYTYADRLKATVAEYDAA